jgi:hypothetical protein
MSLDLPVPTVTIGPDWAEQLNAAIEFVDAHDHTTGKGQLITSAAININDDLSINSQNLQNARSYNMQNLGAVIGGPTDLRSIYSVLGELYYNDGLGNQIQLTAGGALNASTILLRLLTFITVPSVKLFSLIKIRINGRKSTLAILSSEKLLLPLME